MPTRELALVALNSLVSNARNPKEHDIDLIRGSVARFGFIEPIVRDDRTGKIIGGHGRAETLRGMEQRGDRKPDGITVDDQGNWCVPVIIGWASENDAEADAAMIALNRSTEVGGWIDHTLLELLDDLASTDEGLAGVGFDDHDLDDLRAKLEESDDGTVVSPSMDDWAEKYEQQGRRLVVLDYNPDEYREVVARLGVLRDRFGADNNSAAVMNYLIEQFPDVEREVEDEAIGA